MKGIEQRACTFKELAPTMCLAVIALLEAVGQTPSVECLPGDLNWAASSYPLAISHLHLDIDCWVDVMSLTHMIQVVSYALAKSFFPSVSEDVFFENIPLVPGAESLGGDR